MRSANHVHLPTIITEPGQYLTRCGETVSVTSIIRHRLAGTPVRGEGRYFTGVAESWDVSGRLYPNVLSDNDIVSKE